MSQENVEIVRRLHETGNRDDLPAILELLDPGFEWWDRKDDPGATVHRGHDGFTKHMAELEADVEMQVEVNELSTPGTTLSRPSACTVAAGPGAPSEEHEVHVFRLRDGKIIELREYRQVDALEPGLSEQDAHADS